MCHEVGHIFLGYVDNDKDRPDTSNDEWEANFFASIMSFLIQGAMQMSDGFDSYKSFKLSEVLRE